MTELSTPQILRWRERHSQVLILGIFIYGLSGFLWPLVTCGLLSFGYYLFSHVAYLKTLRPVMGYANYVTVFRIGLVCFGGYSYQVLPHQLLFLLFATAMCLDVVDGYLARKFQNTSDFGLYFDREGDAFFVAIVASVLYSEGLIDGWLLLPAYLSYFYTTFLNMLPGEPKKEPRYRFSSTIAGIFFVMLLLPFVFAEELYAWPLRLGGVLILFSFSISLYHQLYTPASET